MRFTARTLLLALSLLFSPDVALAAPADIVETYHNQLIQAVDETHGQSDEVRFKRLAPAMDAAFDFESMIKTIAGSYWQKASPDAREGLLRAFRRISIATYADQFGGMTDGAFDVKGTRDGPRGLKLVDSQLKTASESVKMTYVVRDKGGAWQIIDVLLKGGISELAVRASEYSNILKSGGVEGLTSTLNDQAVSLLKTN
ncbi:MAG: ABC transporter substrate-binding protein [Rhodospirillales bacterium]|nr:ABC transporter substrate-binding protein [Rhodospirillales bacterium]